MTLRRRTARHSADVLLAVLITLVAFGSPWGLASVLLAAKLNAFALPLALAGVLTFPLWFWYCLGLLWVTQALYYLRVDIPTAAGICRDRLRDVRGDVVEHESAGAIAATDGGTDGGTVGMGCGILRDRGGGEHQEATDDEVTQQIESYEESRE